MIMKSMMINKIVLTPFTDLQVAEGSWLLQLQVVWVNENAQSYQLLKFNGQFFFCNKIKKLNDKIGMN